MPHSSIYVAASSQHVGKTTSTLGIVHALRKQGYNVGYCKPVGQEFLELGNLRVDKDALLFSSVMDFELASEVHSPVIIGSGVTSAYLEDDSAFDFKEDILRASSTLGQKHDLIVYEGTGHPGVGKVVDLSNADVARLLGAKIVMIVEGGIGNTIDRLHLSLSLFQTQNIPILGVIINKVRKDKIDKVRKYVGRWLDRNNIPLLGVVPYDKSLSNPIMATIATAVSGEVLLNGDRLHNQVEDIIAGSLLENHVFGESKNILVVTSARRLRQAIEDLAARWKKESLESIPVSGFIVTGDGIQAHNFLRKIPHETFFTENKIPLISTRLDTFGSVVKITKMEVKINVNTPWKSLRAIQLIRENVDFDLFMEGVGKKSEFSI